ncbi:ABC transporter ATP-binding protein [Ferrovibrio sp.]|uniref:ABC transporter ATP-binding protein n=1 Tax=Ferrovibrio sp. TaxID=1917215 RepID=UPI003D14CE2F
MNSSVRHLLTTGLPRRKWQLAGVLCLGLLAGLSEGAGLMLLGVLIDRFGLAGGKPETGAWQASLETVLVIYTLLVIAMALVTRARIVVAARLRFRAVEVLRDRLVRALLHMEWPALQRVSTPRATQLLTSEVIRVSIGIELLLNATAIIARLPILLAVAVLLSPHYALSMLVILALFGMAATVMNRALRRSGERFLAAGTRMQTAISEALSGRHVIKSMNLEAAWIAHFAAAGREIQEAQVIQASRLATSQAAAGIAVALMAVAGLVIAVYGFGTALADAMIATLAFARLGQSCLRIHDSWRTVLLSLPAEAAIRQMLDEAQRNAEPGQASDPLPLPRQTIELRDVSISRGGDQPLLQLPDARIAVGQITLVTGPSGSGKTTLVDAVMGLQVPAHGELRLDGKPLAATERRAWRSQISYLPQDAFLFNETIRHNLLQAYPTATEPELWQALEKADVGALVRQLPQQLDTIVGERGDSLSGGERQRIALARALVRQPALLILDEPTSALDTESEARIVEVLQRLKGGMTILIVTHRAAFHALADHVITLDGWWGGAAMPQD